MSFAAETVSTWASNSPVSSRHLAPKSFMAALEKARSSSLPSSKPVTVYKNSSVSASVRQDTAELRPTPLGSKPKMLKFSRSFLVPKKSLDSRTQS